MQADRRHRLGRGPNQPEVLRISCTPLSWKILASHWFAAGLLEEAAAHPQRLTAQGKGAVAIKSGRMSDDKLPPVLFARSVYKQLPRQSKYRVECRTAHTSSAAVADGRRQGLRGFLLPIEQPGDSPCSISHQSCGVLSVSPLALEQSMVPSGSDSGSCIERFQVTAVNLNHIAGLSTHSGHCRNAFHEEYPKPDVIRQEAQKLSKSNCTS